MTGWWSSPPTRRRQTPPLSASHVLQARTLGCWNSGSVRGGSPFRWHGRFARCMAWNLTPEMVEALRAKAGGCRVRLHVGDMSRTVQAGQFDLVFIAFGTLFALPTQDDQVRCFQSAADQLTEGGQFVVEALVPQPGTYTDGRKVTVASADEHGVILNVSVIDTSAQVLSTQQVELTESSVRMFPNRIRYAWPAERDLMARLAGFGSARGGATGRACGSITVARDTSRRTSEP